MNDIAYQVVEYARRNRTKICIKYNDEIITGSDLLRGGNNFVKILNKYPNNKTCINLVSSFSQKVYSFLGCLIANKCIFLIDSTLNIFQKIYLIKKYSNLVIHDDSFKMKKLSKLFKNVEILPDEEKEITLVNVLNYDFDQMKSFTSGSTGEPKMIKRSRFFLNHQFNTLKQLFIDILGEAPQVILTNQTNIIFILISLGHQCIIYDQKTTILPTEVNTVIGSTSMIDVLIDNSIGCNNIILGGSPLYNRMIRRLKNSYPFSTLR